MRFTTQSRCSKMEISTASDRSRILPQATTPTTGRGPLPKLLPHRASTVNLKSTRTTSTISNTTPSSDRRSLGKQELRRRRALHRTTAPTLRDRSSSSQGGERSLLGAPNRTTVPMPRNRSRQGEQLPRLRDLPTTVLMRRSRNRPLATRSSTAGIRPRSRRPRSNSRAGAGTRTTRPTSSNRLHRLRPTSTPTTTRSTTHSRRGSSNRSRIRPLLHLSHPTILVPTSTNSVTMLCL